MIATFAIVQIVLKKCVTSSLHVYQIMHNTLTHTFYPALYYQTMNLANHRIHSQRTDKNKCFISGFSRHIVSRHSSQCCYGIVSDTVNTFLHVCSKQQNVMHVCVGVFTFVEGLRTSSVPSESLS